MYTTTKAYKILSYNVMSNPQLSGLLNILDLEKPDIVLVQELTLNTEDLKTFLSSKRGYSGASNTDETDIRKPGTGIIWHDSVPISRVTALESRRLQYAYIGPYPIVNVYLPAGTDNVLGRREFFREQLFRVMRGLGTKLPILGGDWNCVTNVKDIEGGDYGKKRSQDLSNLVRDFNLSDAFRQLHPDKREYTWSRKFKFSSRLDRFYLPPELIHGLLEVSHHPYLSDHKYVRMVVRLPEVENKVPKQKIRDSGFWKLNIRILDEDDFLLDFSIMWERLLVKKTEFGDCADWWDQLVKPECRAMCMRFSAMMARCNRGQKQMLMVMLEFAQEQKDWAQVTSIRARLREIMRKESLGFKVRSRFKENLECEKASLFHVNREKKKSGQRTISKLLVGGEEVEDRETVENEVCGYFESLFSGHHRRGGINVGEVFQPNFTHINEFLEGLGKLTEESKAKVEADIKLDELEKAVSDLNNNKAPGLDGLPAEFYKTTGGLINKEFLEVLNCQLARLRLVESDIHGATRLGPKVDGVPRVDQLRPITLLNLDYKILTKIITNRLVKVMEEIILSGQSCTVPGQNILFGASNILSVIQYIEKYGGKAAAVSYDLYKAFDRVCLAFLYRVMEKMNFGVKFIEWIRMCHAGATTCFILNFLTRQMDLKISVRQGDPLAMILFLIYMEPLLMKIRSSIRGTFFYGEREHDFRKQGMDQWREAERCVNTKDTDFVDDTNIIIQNEEDLVIVDRIFTQFEDMSGAILNRDSKTKIMGLGEWQGKQDWALPWVKVEGSLNIFGIKFYPTYEQTLEVNWNVAKKGFVDCLNAWKIRSLETIFQRVQVLTTFAMPKLWYKALLLPLPGKLAGQFEEEIRQFIWAGKLEKPAFAEMCNPVDQGGLGVICIRSKCDSLLLKQLLRMLEDSTAVHCEHMKFWLGNFLRHWEMMGCYPHALRDGEITNMPRQKESALTPHFTKLLEEFKYGEKNKYFDQFVPGNIENVTAKALYQLNTTTFTPPSIIYKREVSDWGLVWGRVGSLMLEPRARELLYMIVNNVYPTMERLHRINMDRRPEFRRVWNNKCKNCGLDVMEDCVHLFLECRRVEQGWLYVKERIQILMQDYNNLNNHELMYLTWPKEGHKENEMTWLVGNWVQLVYEEAVVRDNTVRYQFTRGHFRYKYLESLKMKMPQLNHITDVTVLDPG